MNLGIEGRTALVCASSQGLGLACAQALAQEGVHVVINGRDAAKLDKTAAALRETARALCRYNQRRMPVSRGVSGILLLLRRASQCPRSKRVWSSGDQQGPNQGVGQPVLVFLRRPATLTY